MIPELALFQARARIDLAVINGRLTGWEIKTDVDSLSRLPHQASIYNRIFDEIWLAAAERHLSKAETLVPAWWGISVITTSADGFCCLSTARQSCLNPQVDLDVLVRLLWRHETLEELESLGIGGSLKRAPRTVLWQAFAEAVPSHISKRSLQERIRLRLMERPGWRGD
jgi:hypothetical protein